MSRLFAGGDEDRVMAEDVIDNGGKAVSFLFQTGLGRWRGAAEFFLLDLHFAFLEIVGAMALDEKEKAFEPLEIIFVVTACQSEIEGAAFEEVKGGGGEIGPGIGGEAVDLAGGFESLGRVVQDFPSAGVSDVALEAGFGNGPAKLFLGEFDCLAIGVEIDPLRELCELSVGETGKGFEGARLFHRFEGLRVRERAGLSLTLFGELMLGCLGLAGRGAAEAVGAREPCPRISGICKRVTRAGRKSEQGAWARCSDGLKGPGDMGFVDPCHISSRASVLLVVKKGKMTKNQMPNTKGEEAGN